MGPVIPPLELIKPGTFPPLPRGGSDGITGGGTEDSVTSDPIDPQYPGPGM